MQKAETLRFSGNSPYQSDKLKGHLEEKFVCLYKDIFAGRSQIHSTKERGLQGRASLTRFWDELLLLKVNENFLAQCISKATEDQLKGELKPVLNELFGTYVVYLGDKNFIRVAHALETLAILFREIFKKRFTEQGYTIITLVAGTVDYADTYFKKLITSAAVLLTRDDVPIPVKSLSLRLYLTLLTLTDNINTNAIASYFFMNNIFDAIVAALSVKLSGDRQFLELDATLVLNLLLLWRESENLYLEFLSSPVTPLMPLLETASSLLSYKADISAALPSSNSLVNSDWYTTGIFSFLGNLFGSVTQSDSYVSVEKTAQRFTTSPLASLDPANYSWLKITSGILLTYFLVYLNPVLKSSQVWPSFTSEASTCLQVQSTASVWSQILNSFICICKETFHRLHETGAHSLLQAKLCLIVIRCFLEGTVAAEFLAHCDVCEFSLKPPPSSGITGITYIIPFKSLSCLIVDLAVEILMLNPHNVKLDTELFSRAAILIPLTFNHLKQRGWQLAASSIDWLKLWKGLTNICCWTGDKTVFHKPGAPELAELLLGIIESCLSYSQDICPAIEESESLHALIMANLAPLERLASTASSIPKRNGMQLVNIMAIKLQYEIQIAAMGVRGDPTYDQALQAVRKRGMANLIFKPRHAGPTHAYAEGTGELRLLINITRFLLAERQRQSFPSTPKLEAM